MRSIQLYGTASAGGSAIAQVTIPVASTIKGCQVALMFDSITDNSNVKCELSKVPSSQIGVNGAQDPFLEVAAFQNFVTSGLVPGSICKFFPLNVPCRQGEIIYLHATTGGTITFYFTAILFY